MKTDEVKSLKLSIIIVSFNTANDLQTCLRSIKSQNLASEDYDVIVVDNASTDESVTVARSFEGTRVEVLSENVGYARANNIGIRASNGRLILLLNPDCELRNGSITALLNFFESHKDAGVIGAKLLNQDGSLQPSGREFPTLARWWLETTGLYRLKTEDANLDARRDYNESCPVDEVSGACMLLRREALEQIGLLDESFFLLWEDVDLCRRLRQAGWNIYYCADAHVIHTFGASRKQVSSLVRLASERSAEHYFRKHHGWSAFLFVRATHLVKRLLRPIILR